MANHPLHPQHPIERIDAAHLSSSYQGQWQCDNCSKEFDTRFSPYHCNECDFDLCEGCYAAKKHPRHSHNLYLSKMTLIYPEYRGDFKCDACCQNKGLGTSDALAYHCFEDQFDLCMKCFEGQHFVIHRHPLIPVNAADIYDNAAEWWICDICRRNGHQLQTRYSWHCSVCEFDCCNNCLMEVHIDKHPEHPLKLTDPFNIYPEYEGCWKCDECNIEYSPASAAQSKPYHCYTCQYDICLTCYAIGSEVIGSDVTGPPRPEHPREPLIRPQPNHKPPVEILDDEADETPIESLDDSQKCSICFIRPKNATIVHGHTGHVCACLRCAYTLLQRGDKCPICRADIDNVIRHFMS